MDDLEQEIDLDQITDENLLQNLVNFKSISNQNIYFRFF